MKTEENLTPVTASVERANQLAEHVNQLTDDLWSDLEESPQELWDYITHIWDEYNCSPIDVTKNERIDATLSYRLIYEFLFALPAQSPEKTYLLVNKMIKHTTAFAISHQLLNMHMEYVITTDDEASQRRAYTNLFRTFADYLDNIGLLYKAEAEAK